jgi:PAS domain S-box-containing protein
MSSIGARYGVALLLIFAVLLIRLPFQPWLGASIPYLQLFPAVMLAAWLGGLGPGIFAVLAGAACAQFLVLPPLFSFGVEATGGRVSLALFVVVGSAIAALVESVRRSELAHRAATWAAEAHARELDAVFEALPDATYVGTADGITRVNAVGLKMLGAASVDDLHDPITELGTKFSVRDTATGEPLPASRLQFARALQGEVVAEEVLARRADTGADVYIRSSAAPIRLDGRVIGAVAINADVTEQRRAAARLEDANRALSRATRRLTEVVANVPGVVWEAWGQPDTATQRIDFVSEHVRTLLGYEPEEWTATPNFWLSIVHPDDKERAAARARATYEGGTVGRNEFRWVHKNGTVLWVEAHSSVIHDDAGQPVGMRGVTLDISARKRYEQERAELLARAEAARAEAMEANRLKDDFLATLSHELRTPLNAVLGYVRMLRQGIVEGDRRSRALEIAERNATVLTQMVGDVLDVSRIVGGKIRLNIQAVDLPAVLEEAVETIRSAAEAKGVQLQVIADPQAGPISGDPDRLQQVIWNLLSNAVRFTPRDGRVQVRLLRADSHVEIDVSDTGMGIDSAFLPHVFERFRQADSRFSREHGGLGLGLAIVRDLVELHGGTVHAFSDGPGTGATFRVRLPLMSVSPAGVAGVAAQAPAETGGGEQAPPNLRGVRLLVVDDEEDALALMRDVLESAGATVLVASGAAGALSILATVVPAAVVTDLGMPGMDGFELLAAIRASPEPSVRILPVAALTAYARSEDRTRALRAGFALHLAKPIDPAELLAAASALVARRPA